MPKNVFTEFYILSKDTSSQLKKNSFVRNAFKDFLFLVIIKTKTRNFEKMISHNLHLF